MNPARPSAGTKISSRQDAKSAKKIKADTHLSLGDLCVFARDIILVVIVTYTFPQNYLEVFFSCYALAMQIKSDWAKTCHPSLTPDP